MIHRKLIAIVTTLMPMTATLNADDDLLTLGGAWRSHYMSEDAPSIRLSDGGINFESRGIAKFERMIEPLGGAMEFVADIDLSRGGSQQWRNNGIVITLSSAPVDKMGEVDWCVLFATIQQGAIATVQKGGARWGALRPNDARNIWVLQGGDIAPRYTLTMSGGGGQDYSVAWPARHLDGVTMRFHAWRDASDQMRVTIFHGEAPAGPWWESEARLPPAFKDVPLRYVTVFVGQEAIAFSDVEAANAAAPGQAGDGRGNGVFAGRITALRVSELTGDAPRWNTPLPAEDLDLRPRPVGIASMWLPEGGVEEIRRKFNDPRFASYRQVMLRNATPKDHGDATNPNNFNAATQSWAYILTGDRSYFDSALAAIDLACGVTDGLPAMKAGAPGRQRQALNVNEFQVHRFEALAQAYDLLYDELDDARRDAIRRALMRALHHYVRQTDRKDWWYVSNPSNTIGVGNGTNGLIALTLRHENPELAKKIVDRAVNLIHNQYVGVADDGGCNEGNMYWNYGMSFPLMFGYALRNAEGDDRGLLSSPKIRNAYRYIQTNMGGDGKMIPFNDTQPWLNGWMVCSLAGAEFDQPLMRWMADHMASTFANATTYPEMDRGPYALMAFLFRDDTPPPSQFPGLPTLSTLESIEEGVMRSDGALTPRLLTAVKGNGKINTHHANQDQGSFMLYADGQMMLLDPGYFEGEAQKHSLPLIGDAAKMTLNHTAHCRLLDAWESGDVRTITVDATAAYTDKKDQSTKLAQRVRRVFVQVGDEALIVLSDVVPTDSAATVTEQYQAAVVAEATGVDTALLRGERGDIFLQAFGPATSLTVTPRDFKKDWVFKKSGYLWNLVSGEYMADPARPRITVLRRVVKDASPAPAAVTYAPEAIDVKLPGGTVVRFVGSGEDGWSVAR